MTASTKDSGIFVIFGSTGDLSRRKLLPALCRLAERGEIGDSRILGISRSGQSDEAFRAMALEALIAAGRPREVAAEFIERLHDHAIGQGRPEDFRTLGPRLEALSREHGLAQNRGFYLALPPSAVPSTVVGPGTAGLSKSSG